MPAPRLDPITGDAVVLVNELVRLAVAQRASDIHLEPKHDMMQVRLRVDGALVDVQPIALAVAANVVSRVKVLAKMDIAERRMPQDGQIALEFEPGKRVHLRASTFPRRRARRSSSGSSRASSSDRVREARDSSRRPRRRCATSSADRRASSSRAARRAPARRRRSTRSCSSSTRDRVNVVTLEDPVEVELYGVTQGQVNVRTGFTFASGLRAILRQDPDVILVGEIRDSETAGIAMQAALTGHLVLSTLHTSDTVETMVRLVDLGVEPWIVANALSAVLAQRLVRVVCPHCKRPAKLDRDVWDGDELLATAGTDVVQPGGLRPLHAHRLPRAHRDLRGRRARRRAPRARQDEGAGARTTGRSTRNERSRACGWPGCRRSRPA